jgi:hypothetical protein
MMTTLTLCLTIVLLSVMANGYQTNVLLFSDSYPTNVLLFSDGYTPNVLLFRDGYQTAAGSLNLNLRLGDRLTLELAEGGIYEPLTSNRGYSIFSAHRIG